MVLCNKYISYICVILVGVILFLVEIMLDVGLVVFIAGFFLMLRSPSGSHNKNRFASVFMGRKLKYYCIS